MTSKYPTVRGDPVVFILGILLVATSVALLPTQWYFLAPAPALGLILALMLWRWPLWGFCVVIFLIPFDQYRTLSEQFQWLTISKFIGAFLVLVVLAKWLILRDAPMLRSRLWPCLGVFMLSAVLATLSTQHLLTALNELRQLAVAILFFMLTLSLVSYRALFQSVPLAVVLSVACSAMLALFGYVTANPLFVVQAGNEMIRAVGGSNQPNLFSISLLFALPLLVCYFFEAKKLRWRIAAAALALINIMAIVATFSRGAAFVLMFLTLLLSIEHYHRLSPRKIGLFLATVLAIGFMASAFIPASYWERQRSVTETSDDSIARRTEYIKLGLDQFIKSPLIGHGPGVFKELWAEQVYSGKLEKGASGGYYRQAHNTYMEMLVGMGLFGLASYLCFIFRALRNFHEAQRRLAEAGRNQEASIAGAYKIAFMVILFHFLIASAQTHKFFWISLAFSQILLVGSKDSTEARV